jgi:hypothetical protein
VRSATWHISGSVLSGYLRGHPHTDGREGETVRVTSQHHPIRIASGPFAASTAPAITG